MDSKKISFGFSKSVKKPNIFTAQKVEEKSDIQLIDCLEGHSIKVIGAKEETKAPLVIPLKDDAKDLLDRIRETRRKEKIEQDDDRSDSELTLDELAARQLLQEAKLQTAQNGTKIYEVPLPPDKLLLNGEKEPTLEDYENVPISDFGFAMLRGMGWKKGMNIGKNQQENIEFKEPEVRPKGLGLGATKMVNETKPKVAVDKEGKELQLIKGAYAKIVVGVHKGKYGEVQGLDDETGRIIIKTTISNDVLSLNEFLVVPVTEEEYVKCSKILNLEKYKEYKLKQNESSVPKIEHESEQDQQRSSTSKKDESPSSNSSDDCTKRKHSSSRKRKGKKRRSRSRSPKRHSKSRKSKHRSKECSYEEETTRRHEKSESSDEVEQRRHKKKLKKSRRDSDNERQRKRSKKNKSRRYESSSTSSEDDKHKHGRK